MAINKFSKMFIAFFLSLVGFGIGNALSAYLYYDIFVKFDPYSGPTLFRIILTAVSQGVVVGILINIYTNLLSIKNKFFLYFLLSTIFILLSIGYRIYFYHFLLGIEFDLIHYFTCFLSIDFFFPVAILLSSFFITIVILNFIILLLSCPND